MIYGGATCVKHQDDGYEIVKPGDSTWAVIRPYDGGIGYIMLDDVGAEDIAKSLAAQIKGTILRVRIVPVNDLERKREATCSNN